MEWERTLSIARKKKRSSEMIPKHSWSTGNGLTARRLLLIFFSIESKLIMGSVNTVYRLMLSGSEHNQMLFDAISGLMRQRLSDNPDLIDKLIPKFEIGCRRLNPGDGYLEALQQPNAEWCFEGIEAITKTGIRTAAGEEGFDLIVYATGFDTTFVPGWELMAREGRRLDVEWKKVPEAYFSICAGGIPNYFIFNGPNCPIGHGSVPQMISWTADYMLK